MNELKAMMAYVLLNYDVKLEKEGIRPSNIYKGIRLLPNPSHDHGQVQTATREEPYEMVR